jgi:surface polysaccharide O-acyltransferase-like enzyme
LFKPVITAIVFSLLLFWKNQIHETTKSTICVCSNTTESIDRFSGLFFKFMSLTDSPSTEFLYSLYL